MQLIVNNSNVKMCRGVLCAIVCTALKGSCIYNKLTATSSSRTWHFAWKHCHYTAILIINFDIDFDLANYLYWTNFSLFNFFFLFFLFCYQSPYKLPNLTNRINFLSWSKHFSCLKLIGSLMNCFKTFAWLHSEKKINVSDEYNKDIF